jgi:excisionase family DNA binding protein
MVDALSADWLSPAEAADLLGVSPRRVYALIDDGRLRAERVGGRILVHRDSVEARASGAAASGRPFSARRGWALLLLAAGLEPVGLPSDARSKLRRVLRERDLWAMRARFGTRAEQRVRRAHASDLARIAADPAVVRSGVGAAADAGLPLVAPGAPLELYVDAAAAERLIDRYRLSPSPRGNVTLRVVPDEVRAWLTGPVAPWPAVALDLAEDADPRSRDVARAALSRS